MKITRSYEVELNYTQKEALKAIINQRGVRDSEELEELIKFVNKKLTQAFNAGIVETQRLTEKTKYCR